MFLQAYIMETCIVCYPKNIWTGTASIYEQIQQVFVAMHNDICSHAQRIVVVMHNEYFWSGTKYFKQVQRVF